MLRKLFSWFKQFSEVEEAASQPPVANKEVFNIRLQIPPWKSFEAGERNLFWNRRTLLSWNFGHSLLGTCSHFYRPPRKLREGNVFTGVCLSFNSRGSPMWPLPMTHWTSPPGPLVLTPSPWPWPPFQTLHIGIPPVVTSGDCSWRPVQNCSLEDPLPVLTSGGHWKHVHLASGCYASYWDPFFCSPDFF